MTNQAFDWNSFSALPQEEEEEQAFDWNSYKPIQQESKNKPEFRDIVSEELREHGYEPNTEEEFERLAEKGIAQAYKGYLNTASFGLSKHIPSLKPGENFAAKVGEIAGYTLPFEAYSKLVGFIPTATKNLPKAAQFVEKMARSGATFGGVKATEELASGKAPGKETFLATAEGAALHALLGGLGKTGSLIWNQIQKLPHFEAKAAKELEKILLGGEEIPRSIFKTQEAALQELQPVESKLPFGQTKGESPSLTGRVTQKHDELGLRPPEAPVPKNIKEDVGKIFSERPFYNTTEAGKAVKNQVMKLDEEAYRKVNNLYKKSRELNANIEEIHPNLVNNLQDRLSELKKIPEPSGPQKQLISALDNILNSLVLKSEEGVIQGYKPISNQTLIDQIQSLRQKIDYDFAHGGAKNIFKPTINDIQTSVRNAAEQSGNGEALKSFDEARSSYKDWAETFDSDYVRPFRDVTNKDFSKLFKGSLDFDEANVLKEILNKSPEGQELVKASTRELVEKNLGKFFENPGSYTTSEFNKALRELEGVISPDQSKAIKEKFIEHAPKPPKFKATKVDKKVSEYLGKEPEYVGEKLNSRSGIRQLKKDLSKTDKGKALFKDMIKQKARSILNEGKVHTKSTSKDIYNVINKEKNRELFAEMVGEKEIDEVLDQLAKKENQGKTLLFVKDAAKNVAMVKFLKFIWPALI